MINSYFELFEVGTRAQEVLEHVRRYKSTAIDGSQLTPRYEVPTGWIVLPVDLAKEGALVEDGPDADKFVRSMIPHQKCGL